MPTPTKKLISRMRVHFQHPVIHGDEIHTYCDFETWESNEVRLVTWFEDKGIRATWKHEELKESRFIPFSNIALVEVTNYDVSS